MGILEGALTDEERWWWERIRHLVPDAYPTWVGMRQWLNPLPCPDTSYTFEFGDIRIEAPVRTVLVEIEGKDQGASLVSLLKYWPWLKGEAGERPRKSVTMLHVWAASWPTQKVLWRQLKRELLDRAPFVVPAEFIAFPNGRADEEAVLACLRSCLSIGSDIEARR
jgi:hypothetical protein